MTPPNFLRRNLEETGKLSKLEDLQWLMPIVITAVFQRIGDELYSVFERRTNNIWCNGDD